ncbi:MAG TPA: hypothetical protein EYP57_05980 [Thermodesulfobacteriaceae bacterium]|nr:hypothetical protein [Thermodesulfobacteriaceae bacterium]
MTELRSIEKIELSNGLQVEFLDGSRLVAGDRWLVKIVARIPIEVTEENFRAVAGDGALYGEFIRERGSPVLFTLEKERNFIDEKEKNSILETLIRELKQYALPYMGHPAFARGHLKRIVQEFEEKRRWWK